MVGCCFRGVRTPNASDKTNGNGLRPITIAVPAALAIKIKMLAAARSCTLSALTVALYEREVQGLGAALVQIGVTTEAVEVAS